MRPEREYEVVYAVRIGGKRYTPPMRIVVGGKVADWLLEQRAIRVPAANATAPRAAATPSQSARPRVGGCGGCGWRY